MACFWSSGSERRYSTIGVSTAPGCTELTRMPSLAYWMAADLVNIRTAPLDALYTGLVEAWPISPDMEDVLTMEPPPARRISGMAALVPRKTPLALMSITRSHSSTVVSSRVPLDSTPALFTRISSLPKRLTAVATASCHAASLVTSSGTKTHSPPDSLISASVRRPSYSRMSPMTTLAPSLANNFASAAPIPLAPPLISATLFSSRMFLSSDRLIWFMPGDCTTQIGGLNHRKSWPSFDAGLLDPRRA